MLATEDLATPATCPRRSPNLAATSAALSVNSYTEGVDRRVATVGRVQRPGDECECERNGNGRGCQPVCWGLRTQGLRLEHFQKVTRVAPTPAAAEAMRGCWPPVWGPVFSEAGISWRFRVAVGKPGRQPRSDARNCHSQNDLRRSWIQRPAVPILVLPGTIWGRLGDPQGDEVEPNPRT